MTGKGESIRGGENEFQRCGNLRNRVTYRTEYEHRASTSTAESAESKIFIVYPLKGLVCGGRPHIMYLPTYSYIINLLITYFYVGYFAIILRFYRVDIVSDGTTTRIHNMYVPCTRTRTRIFVSGVEQ